MVEVYNRALDEKVKIERVIGRYKSEEPGPTIIFIGGTHGNETSSIFALKTIINYLNENNPPFKGEIVAAYAGNLKALEEHQRYIDKDMNRVWTPESLEKLGFNFEKNKATGNEKVEQQELLKVLKETIEKADEEIYIFDLHTTSSESPPFTAIGDTIRNRELALKYPLPCVVGFDEETTGTFMNYMNEKGFIGIAFEAGEHFSLAAIENNESFIWYTMYLTESMKKENIPEFKKHYNRLNKSTLDARKLFDLKYMYSIEENEEFEMLPGYTTFDKIEEGEVLAKNQTGKIKAPMSGRIFMPLYQKQGDDGFFIVDEITPFWLKFSKFLRNLHLEKGLTVLPGIKSHPNHKRTLIIDNAWHGEKFIQFLHMIGYRRKRFEDDKMIITRREFDVQKPRKNKLRT